MKLLGKKKKRWWHGNDEQLQLNEYLRTVIAERGKNAGMHKCAAKEQTKKM
jgi:hypothetical protein